MINIKRIYKKFTHTLYSTYMCIKYPFLYPRNVFTNTHYVYWPIHEYHREHYAECVVFLKLGINGISDEDYKKLEETTEIDRLNKHLKVEYNPITRLLSISKHGKYISTTLFSVDILPFFENNIMPSELKIVAVTTDERKHLKIDLYYKESENIKLTEGMLHFYDFVINKPLYYKIQILDWIHDYPVQLFHCIPVRSKFDAIPEGWREPIGKPLIKELKAELKKHNYLYGYRVLDIKEKYGGLRWDDTGQPVGSHVFDIVHKYENLSYQYCIHCGQKALYMTRGWIMPICEDCANKINKNGSRVLDDCDLNPYLPENKEKIEQENNELP